MTNPLTERAARANAGSGNFGHDILPGEERVVGREGRTVIVRTNRPYAYDLADAYNASMSSALQRRGGEWIVNGKGDVQLVYSDAAVRQTTRLIAQRKETAATRALQKSFEQ